MTMKELKNNYAFIDWQNLYLWTMGAVPPWQIDFAKFRVYLKEKYSITKAYYFLWYAKDENNWLYTNLQESWFIVVFKKQMVEMKTSKKWNIDSDLIFNVMEKLIEKPDTFDKILLVSWDWDFKILVDYLVRKWRFLKILFPNTTYASSLYKSLWSEYFDYLFHVKKHIEHLKS